jgi:hypothetical protein
MRTANCRISWGRRQPRCRRSGTIRRTQLGLACRHRCDTIRCRQLGLACRAHALWSMKTWGACCTRRRPDSTAGLTSGMPARLCVQHRAQAIGVTAAGLTDSSFTDSRLGSCGAAAWRSGRRCILAFRTIAGPRARPGRSTVTRALRLAARAAAGRRAIGCIASIGHSRRRTALLG